MQCKAKSKQSGERCKKYAVEGYEVCHIHGGKSLRSVDHPNYKHGIYDKYAPPSIREKVIDFLESDPLDLTNELALTRALLSQFLSQFEYTPLDAISISILGDLIANVRRTIESISKIKNDTALTAADIRYLQIRTVDVALKYFPDDKHKQEQFIADLFGSFGDTASGNPQIVEGASTKRR